MKQNQMNFSGFLLSIFSLAEAFAQQSAFASGGNVSGIGGRVNVANLGEAIQEKHQLIERLNIENVRPKPKKNFRITAQCN
jgi:hypothetical protein